jgi:VWFA-related protein
MNPARSIVSKSLAIVLAACAAVPLALFAQARFSETTNVVVVEVPVEVTRDGEPVRGLTAGDFEVFDGRKKQDVVGFEVVDVAAKSEAGETVAEVPVAGRRHILLLFDLAFSNPAAVVRARTAARELVANSLAPSDLVGVALYTPTRGAQLLLGFTSDRQQVELAIETLGLPQLIQAAPDPLGIVFTDKAGLGGPESLRTSSGGGRGGVDPEAEIREILESIDSSSTRANERNNILALTGSLTELAQMMSAVEGRKHVVFLSEGFDSSVLLGTGVSTQEEQDQIRQQNEASATGRVWEVKSDVRFGDTSSLNQLETMAEEFIRADCSIQSVDIGGLRTGTDLRPRRQSDDGLALMADKTGGEYFRNFNDLSVAMGKMLERTSVTYLLAIQPQDLKLDGDYHRLKVKLRDEKGLQVVYRPGYFAPKPFSSQAATERKLQTAGLVMGGRDGGQIDTSVLAAAFPGDSEKAYVPVLVEISGNSLLGDATSGVVPAEIYAYAIAADGEVRDFFTQAMGFDLAKLGANLRQSGFKFFGQFELPPGDYAVRIVVRNGLSGSTGVRTARLRVPSMSSHEATLLPPLFPEPGGKWLLGRQKDVEQSGHAYPFVIGSQAFIPAARPVLRAGQAAQVSLVGYNLGDGQLDLACRLLDADGKPAGDARFSLDGRVPGDAAGLDRLVGRFVAEKVGAGAYTLEVTVTDPASGQAETSSIPVVVEG